MKIYGPYKRKDGRKHIVIVHNGGQKRTQSYPRYLMEQHLKRKLLDVETVDHINEDFTDDRLKNLQLLTREANSAKSVAFRPAKVYNFTCPVCGAKTQKPLSQVKHNQGQGKKGPYCSRKCAGIASHL